MGCPGNEVVLQAGGLAATFATVDELARLQLLAGRAGRVVRLAGASPELRELVRLAGLADVLGVEVERQPEKREERVDVEVEAELEDPPA